MRVVFDIEANSLTKPTKIWLVVFRDIDTNEVNIFRNLTENEEDCRKFRSMASKVSLFVGHNVLEYDFPVLSRLVHFDIPDLSRIVDTLIISRLVNYPREKHSIASYGEQFGIPKHSFNDWTHWSQEMEDYCVRDCEICHRIYILYDRVINDPSWLASIRLEHQFQLVVNKLHTNGFFFNKDGAERLHQHVTKELAKLDFDILEQFPPRLRLVREVHPRRTKYGTLDRKDFRWLGPSADLSDYSGDPFCKCSWSDFNPSSHKQIIEVLQQAGWRPIDKTNTHIQVERELNRLKYSHRDPKGLSLEELHARLLVLGKTGWKVNENNLNTLPPDAPSPARTLARRILYESRRRTLVEWLGLVSDNSRIHGKFVGIGAWTHRMAHQQPNLANIPNAYKEDGSIKLLGKELRSLWRAPARRLLVGVDAEGIQLRIFAHYINEKEFTRALIHGKKSDKTDPHSINAAVLNCTRQQAKRFIYALLLGAGVGKLSQILERSERETKEALDRLLKRYRGFDYLRRDVIPSDAGRGYFKGLDGRKVRIPGDTVGERRHLCMSGYLQNGEAIIMKRATLKWEDKLEKSYSSLLVNLVHDEWQTEVPNNMEVALAVGKLQAESLEEVGQELKLNCPLAGSYYNEDIKDYTIGTNWSVTH